MAGWRRTKAFETFTTRMLMGLGAGTFLSLGLVVFMKQNGDFEPLVLQRMGYDRQGGGDAQFPSSSKS